MFYADVDLAEVLKLINRSREVCSLAPLDAIPPGAVVSVFGCPLALSFKDLGQITVTGEFIKGVYEVHAEPLANLWGTSNTPIGRGGYMIRLPGLFRKFAANFDVKCYDELIASA